MYGRFAQLEVPVAVRGCSLSAHQPARLGVLAVVQVQALLQCHNHLGPCLYNSLDLGRCELLVTVSLTIRYQSDIGDPTSAVSALVQQLGRH